MSAREWYDRWEAERVAQDDEAAERQAERDRRDRDGRDGPC